jgi:hypothetical protein
MEPTQRTEFDFPFPPELSPHLEWIREHNLQWVHRHNLATTSDAIAEYASWNLAEATARIYPDADREALLDNLNFFALGFLFDDQFHPDIPDRDNLVARACAELALIPFRPPGDDVEMVCPITLAWAEIWATMASQTSPYWQTRFAANFARWMTAHARETHLAAAGTVLDVESYLWLRRRSLGLAHSMDLHEWTGRFEVPPVAAAAPRFAALRTLTTDIVAITNDVQSVQREINRGDPNNLIVVLQHTGMSREQALTRATALIYRALARFEDHQAGLRAWCDELGLDEQGRGALYRSVRGMSRWIRGNYDWGRTSGRYSPTSTQVHYLVDLLAPPPAE